MAPVKYLEDITREDFLKSPYWMFNPDKYEPFHKNGTLVPQNHPDYEKKYQKNNSVRLIFTRYTLKNGMMLDGFLYESPPNLDRHTIFYKHTGFETWYGVFQPTRGFIKSIYRLLHLSGKDVFPINWITFGKEYSNVINGFGYLENGIKTEIY